MPLPDERPRQSVANLIGRFEQQTKRQSVVAAAASAPSRTSSSLSNPSGDAAKVEIKEKREWPPKPKQEAQPEPKPSVAETPAQEEVSAKPSLPTPEASPKAEVIELPENSLSASEDSPAAEASPPADPTPAVTKPSPARQSSVGSTVSPAPRSQTSPTKAKATTTRAAPGKPSARAPAAKSPPSSFHRPPGISASTSAPTNVKPAVTSSARLPHSQSQQIHARPGSSASVRPTSTPNTPSRSKTPSTAHPKIPARPKTPSARAALTPSRPKTPSSRPPASTTSHTTTPRSGLFAPTAASLARTRGADDAPPVPVKRQTLSPDVAERLSKPTAASLQKTRVPSTVSSPPPVRTGAAGGSVKRGAAPTGARGGAATRGTTTRGRGGASVVKKTAGGASAAGAGVLATAAVAAVPPEEPAETQISEEPAKHREEAHVEETILHDEPEEHVEELAPEAAETEEPAHSHSSEDTQAQAEPESEKVDVTETAVSHTPDVVAEPEAPLEEDHAFSEANQQIVEHEDAEPVPVHDQEQDLEEKPESEVLDSPSPVKQHESDDLADLVSMLEPKRAVAIADELDIAGEIPDEESDL